MNKIRFWVHIHLEYDVLTGELRVLNSYETVKKSVDKEVGKEEKKKGFEVVGEVEL